LSDLIAVAAVLVAAASLFLPALQQAREGAKRVACQDNLRLLGESLLTYANANGHIPVMESSGVRAFPGNAPLTLHESGMLPRANVVICPSSAMASDTTTYRMPLATELEEADGPMLSMLQNLASGSYGWSLGVKADGRVSARLADFDDNYVLAADAPQVIEHRWTPVNHGRAGQNVLCKDGRTFYWLTRLAWALNDDPFANRAGLVAPGLDRADSVVAGWNMRLMARP
jgi:hypothetical protein